MIYFVSVDKEFPARVSVSLVVSVNKSVNSNDKEHEGCDRRD